MRDALRQQLFEKMRDVSLPIYGKCFVVARPSAKSDDNRLLASRHQGSGGGECEGFVRRRRSKHSHGASQELPPVSGDAG